MSDLRFLHGYCGSRVGRLSDKPSGYPYTASSQVGEQLLSSPNYGFSK